jgi:hypothetical protein
MTSQSGNRGLCVLLSLLFFAFVFPLKAVADSQGTLVINSQNGTFNSGGTVWTSNDANFTFSIERGNRISGDDFTIQSGRGNFLNATQAIVFNVAVANSRFAINSIELTLTNNDSLEAIHLEQESTSIFYQIIQDFTASDWINRGASWTGTLTPNTATNGIQMKIDPRVLGLAQFNVRLQIKINYTEFSTPASVCYVVWKDGQVGEISSIAATTDLNNINNIAAFYVDTDTKMYPNSDAPAVPHQIVRRGFCNYTTQGKISSIKKLDGNDVVYANYTYEFQPPFKVTDEEYENETYLSTEFIKNVHIYNFYNPGGYIPDYSNNQWRVSDSGKYDNPDLYRTATNTGSYSQISLQTDDNVLRRPAMYAVFGDPYKGFRLKNIMRWSQGQSRSDYYYFVADKHGRVYFTKTLSEHNQKVAEIKKNGDWIW